MLSFVLPVIGKPLILSWTIYFMVGNKSPKSFTLSYLWKQARAFFKRVLRNKIYFIAKKYAVRKGSETNMKTIHAKTDSNWLNQYISGVARTPTNI